MLCACSSVTLVIWIFAIFIFRILIYHIFGIRLFECQKETKMHFAEKCNVPGRPGTTEVSSSARRHWPSLHFSRYFSLGHFSLSFFMSRAGPGHCLSLRNALLDFSFSWHSWFSQRNAVSRAGPGQCKWCFHQWFFTLNGGFWSLFISSTLIRISLGSTREHEPTTTKWFESLNFKRTVISQ